MAGASLYGSFRAGLTFGSGDVSLADGTSRWGFKGSHEVSEGLTASYKYESKFNITNAESSGGAGHGHDQEFIGSGTNFSSTSDNEDTPTFTNVCADRGSPFEKNEDDEYEAVDKETGEAVTVADVTCGNLIDEDADSGPGGRISSISLSGGFGTVTLGQFWSASANNYGFAVDPSMVGGDVAGFGGASYRNANTVSYSSSAGDVSFQIDKVLGDDERIEFGASAALGPVGVGLGYWSNANDDASFTGVALSAGAAGVRDLTIGLGSSDDEDGMDSNTSILHVGGSVGDTGLSYAVQIINGETDDDDQNFVIVTNSLGSGGKPWSLSMCLQATKMKLHLCLL